RPRHPGRGVPRHRPQQRAGGAAPEGRAVSEPTRMFSPRRIGAMVLRYVYLLRGSWPRILEMFYWPAMQIILWGFISQFFMRHSSWVAQASGVLLAAVLL